MKYIISIFIVFVSIVNAYEANSTLSLWERQTLHQGDTLSFINMSWYSKIYKLHTPNNIFIDIDNDGDPDVLIYTDKSNVVMIIDDNDNMLYTDKEGDIVDDCWVVDRNGDGLVDRVIDYIDNDGDDQADEMDIRYFKKGKLKWGWFWEDKDNDGKMFNLVNYEYGSAWRSDMSGNNIFYANKYDSINQVWRPFGEAPFAFYDLDTDGKSEAVLRICATPDGYENTYITKQTFHTSSDELSLTSRTKDIDYCNNLNHYFADVELRMKITNVRISYSLSDDFIKSNKYPYFYDFGFTLAGDANYKGKKYKHKNNKRRKPNTTIRIDWKEGINFSNNYIAKYTGFSWIEARNKKNIPAWEGVFWIWERRIIRDTGGKTLKYNIRREFDKDISTKRILYYSPIDKRYHNYGSDEGWLEISYPDDKNTKMAEVRYFDINRDGYFDRWEYDIDNDGLIDRVATIANADNVNINIDYNTIKHRYNNSILPNSIKENQQIINTMKKIIGSIKLPFQVNRIELYLKTQNENSSEKRLYLDMLREFYYRATVSYLRHHNHGQQPKVYGAKDKFNKTLLSSSENYWKFAKYITEFESLYSKGLLSQASKKLNDIYRMTK